MRWRTLGGRLSGWWLLGWAQGGGHGDGGCWDRCGVEASRVGMGQRPLGWGLSGAGMG